MAGYDPNQAPQQGQYVDPNQQAYYDPNDPNAGYEDGYSEEDAYYSDEEGQVSESLPWMAIALVAHALALFIATYIVTTAYVREKIPENEMANVEPDQMPDPEVEEITEEEQPEEQEVVTEPTTPTETETEIETNDQSLVDSTIVSPNQNPDPAESPSPNSGPNSNSGLGGGGGGGGGGPRGGGGGFGGRTGITIKPKAERTNAALQWLADHQNAEGFWSPSKYREDSIRIKKWEKCVATGNVDVDSHVKKEDDKGEEHFKVGLSGLALLAFVGDGHTHQNKTEFSGTVRRSAAWLMTTQDQEGCFGTREEEDFVYNHAVCAMAFAELYALTSSRTYRNTAQVAIDFIVKCQNPDLGWRYGVQSGENDSSVSAWMVLALKSAKIADLKCDYAKIYAGANAWYDKAYDEMNDTGVNVTGNNMRTGYQVGGTGNSRPAGRADWEQNASMDACNAMVRLFTGAMTSSDKLVKDLGKKMIDDLPSWMIKDSEGKDSALKIDYYYWYYGSLATFQIGGERVWGKWEKALMTPILEKYQRGYHAKDVATFGKNVTKGAFHPKKGKRGGGRNKRKAIEGRQLLDEHGSWDCLDPWSEHGGRVYTTAINALTLEVYYRYAKVGAGKKK